MRDESEQVRAQAAEALGTIAQTDSAAAPALAGALGDESVPVRRNVAFALVRLGPTGEAAVPALGDVLHDEDRYVRGDAAQALLRIGTPRALETVLPFLETSRWCPLTTKESHLLGRSRARTAAPVTTPSMEVSPCPSFGSCSAPSCRPPP